MVGVSTLQSINPVTIPLLSHTKDFKNNTHKNDKCVECGLNAEKFACFALGEGTS